MYLFFDTETTGLPRKWKAPVADLENWPRMVQIAWLSYSEGGEKTGEGSFIIKPEGYSIPIDSSRIHGISTERANLLGADLTSVLNQFSRAVCEAKTIVAHNLSFDEMIVGAEFLRKQIPHDLHGKLKICTMESSKEHCAVADAMLIPSLPRTRDSVTIRGCLQVLYSWQESDCLLPKFG